MSNLIKMELYKLRTSKLFFILLCISIGINGIIAGVVPMVTKTLTGKNLNVNLSDIFVSPYQLDMLVMLLFISAVSFLYLDFSNGYIKNIAGQLQNRSGIVLAKFITIAIHNLIFLVAASLSNIIGLAVAGALTADGDILAGLATLMIKWMLSLAICSILMFFAVGLRSKTIAIILGVMFSIGAFSLIYMGISSLIVNFLKVKDFSLGNYMPDSLFSSVNVIKNELVVNGIIVAVVVIVLFYVLTNITFKKRDIK